MVGRRLKRWAVGISAARGTALGGTLVAIAAVMPGAGCEGEVKECEAGQSCGDSSSGGGGAGATGGGGSGGGTGGGGTTAGCAANGGGPAPCGLANIANAGFCALQGTEASCGLVTNKHKYHACGVPLNVPASPLARSSNVEEHAGTGDPQLSCFEPAGCPAKPGVSQVVTMKGKATILSNGCESKNLSINVHKVKRAGGADEADLGELVGRPVTTASDCTVSGVSSAEESCEPLRYECLFEYPGVPTETELVIRTSGPLWKTAYEYNVFIRNDAVNGGSWDHDVIALVADDYGVIAQAAIGAPVTPGNGMILGEVHDCGDVRLQNAVVDVGVQKKALVYFTDDEAHPLPNLAAAHTSSLSLYAAIDVEPGPVSVAAIGRTSDTTPRGIGYLRVRVFPDSVTAVTFRGMSPLLVP